MNFWKKLKKKGGPILCLAPMADVTDAAFRRMIAKYGKPDVMWTEFVSADGLVLAPEEGRKKLLKNLEYSESERPIVAQIFGSVPQNIERAARLVAQLGFDGIDINMGCPDKSVEKQGAGAKLMKNPKLAQEIIMAAKKGSGKVPVSVKTRIGYNKDELETWLPLILGTDPAAVTIHARTRKEMSLVPARWERVKRAVEIRNSFNTTAESAPEARYAQHRRSVMSSSLPSKTLIIGNGDVLNVEDAIKKCEETGADGAMLGRAVFGNPWLFSGYEPTVEEKLKVLVEHAKLFEKLVDKSFAVMKKHFKAYVTGWDGAKELRTKLMETQNAAEVEDLIGGFLASS